MSPIGSLQLTAEECNEILMKRAVAAVQAGNHNHTITTTDQHNAREFPSKIHTNNFESIFNFQQFQFKSKKFCKHWKTVKTIKADN